jgi:uncharacterized protein
VHVNDIGAAIEAGIERGRVHRISVTRFDDTLGSHASARMHAAPARRHSPEPETPASALVVVTAAETMRDFLAGEGCRTATAATVGAELAAAHAAGATSVAVLADSRESARAADLAVESARGDGHEAALLHTITLVQAVAAVAVHDPERQFDDDIAAMAEAIKACRTGELRDEPEGIAVVVGDADFGVFDEAAAAARDLADRLCSTGAELLTVLPGAGSNAGIVTALSDHVQEAWPLVEIQQLPAGDDEPLLLLGAE